MDPLQTTQQSAYPSYPSINPIAGPTKVFGIIYAVLAGLSLIGLLSLGALTSMIATRGQGGAGAGAGALGSILAFIVVLSAVLNGATAYGLLARKSWGRTLLIVTSILELLSIPIGTILGSIALYFFMRGGAQQDYARLTTGQS